MHVRRLSGTGLAVVQLRAGRDDGGACLLVGTFGPKDREWLQLLRGLMARAGVAVEESEA